MSSVLVVPSKTNFLAFYLITVVLYYLLINFFIHTEAPTVISTSHGGVCERSSTGFNISHRSGTLMPFINLVLFWMTMNLLYWCVCVCCIYVFIHSCLCVCVCVCMCPYARIKTQALSAGSYKASIVIIVKSCKLILLLMSLGYMQTVVFSSIFLIWIWIIMHSFMYIRQLGDFWSCC